MTLLTVNDLKVRFDTQDGPVNAVNGVSFELMSGQTLGLVGESGSGKSQTVLALMGLLAGNGLASGTVHFNGTSILNLAESELNRIRAQQISMIFQNPMTSLNPYLRVSDQLMEVLTFHKGLSRKDALSESIRMLDAVRIPDARSRIHLYPHEFSGGMRQRVMIAMSLLCRPQLLIADEPTTALDVTVQAQIMTLLAELQTEFGSAIILITHDLGLVAGSCDNVLVMYGGRVMEHGTVKSIFRNPTHPYTLGLLQAIPRLDQQQEQLTVIPGNPPNMLYRPTGCPFQPRCSHALQACTDQVPPLSLRPDGGLRACHIALEEVQ